jgi:chaperonin GroEL
MVYRPNIDEKLCFVLMPFRDPFHSYYQKIIKPAAADAGLATLRSDEIYSIKAIMSDIWVRIWAARIVIADVTEKNANVNYELGLCDALGVPTIIVAGNVDDLPFDYNHRRCILYDVRSPAWDDKLREDLANTIRVVLAETTTENGLVWPYDTSVLKDPIPSGVLLAGADSRKIVIRGAKLVRDAIGQAFGPRGSSVSISQAFGGTVQVHRGVQIARAIKSSNPLEDKGIQQVTDAASSTYKTAGDSSKLVSILTTGFMTKGQELVEKGFHSKDVVKAMGDSIEQVLRHIAADVQKASPSSLLAVATTAAGGDRRVGNLVVLAMKRAGPKGIVTVETSESSETTLEVQEGILFGQGYLSEYFITDPKTLECVLENCLILLCRSRIQSMRELLPLLEQVARSENSLLVIAENVEGEALSTLAVNKIKGTLRCAAVRAPGHADRRRAVMEDIAVLTGGKVLSDELSVPLSAVRLQDLGKAEKIIVTQHDTTILGGGGSSSAIEERIHSVQTQIASVTSDYEVEKLHERLAQLAGSVATIRAGGVTEADLDLEKYKLESAMHVTRSASENGTIIGGCVPLFRAGIALQTEVPKNELDADVKIAVASVLAEPIHQLIENSQNSFTQIIAEIEALDSPSIGFNAETCKVADLRDEGVLDAAKPVELSLKVALSRAGSVLRTGTWDLSVPEPRSNESNPLSRDK